MGRAAKRVKRAMGESDQRYLMRDQVVMVASLRFAANDHDFRVEIRNLSARGLMAEGDFPVTRGAAVALAMGNSGWVDGIVAWVQDSRFGIAFDQEIAPACAQVPPSAFR